MFGDRGLYVYEYDAFQNALRHIEIVDQLREIESNLLSHANSKNQSSHNNKKIMSLQKQARALYETPKTEKDFDSAWATIKAMKVQDGS